MKKILAILLISLLSLTIHAQTTLPSTTYVTNDDGSISETSYSEDENGIITKKIKISVTVQGNNGISTNTVSSDFYRVTFDNSNQETTSTKLGSEKAVYTTINATNSTNAEVTFYNSNGANISKSDYINLGLTPSSHNTSLVSTASSSSNGTSTRSTNAAGKSIFTYTAPTNDVVIINASPDGK